MRTAALTKTDEAVIISLDDELEAIDKQYLHPGHLFASANPTQVTTILGSCVAVCLWDHKLSVGGVNHFLLPHRTEAGANSARFGNYAMSLLLEKMLGLGCARSDLRAKLFGGSCVIEAFRGRDSHLGAKNVEIARKFLSDEGIAVIADDVGGNVGRKIVFDTRTGAVFVKLLGSGNAAANPDWPANKSATAARRQPV